MIRRHDVPSYKEATRQHIAGLQASLARETARADEAERRERQLGVEHRNLRRRIAELEAELQSRGSP